MGCMGCKDGFGVSLSGPEGAPTRFCIAKQCNPKPVPSDGFGVPSDGFAVPSNGFGLPSDGFGLPSDGFGLPSDGFRVSLNGPLSEH